MRMKKVIAGLLATAMVLTGLYIAPKQVEAKVSTNIIYQEVSDIVAARTMIGVSAPVFEGVDSPKDENYGDVTPVDATAEYLFGGWYVNDGTTFEWVPVESVEDISWFVDANSDGYDDNTDSSLCIKWVPASILNVKAQNTANTAAESSSTNTRVISAVDSLDYAEVGFEILLNNKTSLGELKTTKVYEKLNANEKDYYPSDIFGGLDVDRDKDASQQYGYFIVWRLTGIEKVNFGKIINVRPYWVTADGVKVEGLAKYVHVEDEYKGYISVPVNLNVLSKDQVAAGVFEISCPDGLKLVQDKVEVGRVFEEMEFADKGSSIKFAANVEDINNNAYANDIFVNLRFELDGAFKGHKGYDFEIKGTPDFCDNEEKKVEIDIWDVLY